MGNLGGDVETLRSQGSLPSPVIRDAGGFAAAKAAGIKIVMVTAYDTWSSRLLADAPVDCLLVGDSAMMVVHGEKDTLGATPAIMEMHTRAVVRGAGGKFVVADMPFLAARKGEAHALECAAGLLRAGAHAVKIEGAQGHTHVIRHLVESGIPVMGHLGLTPQWVRGFGGFKVQARAPEEAGQLREDASALEQAGVFALVLECIPQALAAEVTAALRIPTIGIGAGAACDGQVLVLHDLLGFNPDFRPRFSRRFADGAGLFRDGAAGFAEAVRSGEFPGGAESF
jgi:3-methyl-2-oxobutanoate hydroxymethyltransferase